MPQNLRIAIPLALAICLLGVLVILLQRQFSTQTDGTTAAAVPSAGTVLPETTSSFFSDDTPLGSVEDPRKPPSKERFLGRKDGLHRWNLQKLPKGWDPDLAKSMHATFELMDELEAATRKGGSGADLQTERERFREFLASLGPECLPTLNTVLGHEPDFVYRRFMYNAIGELGPESEEATWYLRDYFMKRQKDPGNRSEVGNVVKAMEKLQNDTSFEVLQELVRNDTVRPYREKLIFALGEHHRRDDATGAFVDGLHESGSKKNRLRYAQALGKIRDSGTLPDLYHAFQKENYWVAKQTILGTIGKIGNPNSIPFLEEQCRYAKEGAVRLAAGRALSRVGTPHAIETLRSISNSEPDKNVRGSFSKWAKGEE